MEKRYLSELVEGDSIVLKKHELALAEKMFEYICQDRERLSRFLPWPPYIKTVADEMKFIEDSLDTWNRNASANYGIFRKSDMEYIGNVSSF
jgi:ribosomal-protein-serine acetyltransferase